MYGKTLDQFNAKRKATIQAGRTPKTVESEHCSNMYSQDAYENNTLRDSTSEWEKQKQALKKINSSINSKENKDKKSQPDQDLAQPSE